MPPKCVVWDGVQECRESWRLMTIHSTVGDHWRFYTGKGNMKIYSQCFVKDRLEESKRGG